VAFLADGKLLSICHNHTIHIWDAQTGSKTKTLEGDISSAGPGDLSTDRQLAVSGFIMNAWTEDINQDLSPNNLLSSLQIDENKVGSASDYNIHAEASANTSSLEGSEIENDSDEYENYSDAYSDQDTWSIDEGPCELPNDLPDDTHITSPQTWLAKLCALEHEVVNSSLVHTYLHEQTTHQQNREMTDSFNILSGAIRNYQRLVSNCYCADAVIAIVANQQRPNVACLVRISGEEIHDIQQLLTDRQTTSCLDRLSGWGFHQSRANIERIRDDQGRLATVASTMAKFLDLAIICYSGAYIEPFDEKFLDKSDLTIRLHDTLMLHKRSLSCLDEYLGRQPIWVFEDVDEIRPASRNSMHVSTTINDFNDIWGPVWITVPKSEEKEMRKSQPPWAGPIVSYNIGPGWIIPSQGNLSDPTPANNEFLAHWTTDERELDDLSPFPASVSEPRLLIGATKLLVNEKCELKVSKWTSDMKSLNRIKTPGTKVSKREQDSQTFTLAYNAAGVTAGYQEQWKRRAGCTLKDRTLASWVNEPDGRNPSIMADRLAVEISACSGNARRQRLIRILATETMRNYLRSIGFRWWRPEAEGLYFTALEDRDARAFERLYLDRQDLRRCLGRAVGQSLKVLLETGVDSNSCLRALWLPTLPEFTDAYDPLCPSTTTSLKLLSAVFPHESSRWSGLLLDTIDSCTVAVVSTQCLTLGSKQRSRRFGCKTATQTAARTNQKTHSILETVLCVNDKAQIPCPLPRTSSGRWDLPEGAEFDLGASGRLKFLGHAHGARGLLMKWSAPSAASSAIEWFYERVKKRGPRPYHWEQVDNLAGPHPVQIFVVS
jgi:hypothetical protein